MLIVVPAGAAAAWSAVQPMTYAVELDLLHEPSDTSTADTIDRQLATHQVLLLRRSLLEDAARSVGRDPDELIQNVSIDVVEQSSVLRLRVVDPDRDRARQTATLVAERYVGIADELAPTSNIGLLRIIAAPTALDDPVAPQPVRAGVAGALVGVVLAVVFLVVTHSLHRGGRRSTQ